MAGNNGRQYLVAAGSLWENPQHSPASVVQTQPPSQLTPQRTASALSDVTQLDHTHSNQTVVARETVVLGTDV